jgi:hypothetical protein
LDGVVVRWRARRGQGPGELPADTITLRILRPTATAGEFTAVGTSEDHDVPDGASDPISVREFPTRLPIKIGDRLGLGTIASRFPSLETPGASYLVRISALADGQTATFAAGAFADQAVLINADIEPDADADGFGDETQDGCPTDSSKQGDCTPPETTITKRPPNKTKKHRVKFRFKSSEPGSSFACKLDKKKFKPCTSPKKYKRLKRGKHRFKVRATDAAANSDPTPAKDRFKVVK